MWLKCVGVQRRVISGKVYKLLEIVLYLNTNSIMVWAIYLALSRIICLTQLHTHGIYVRYTTTAIATVACVTGKEKGSKGAIHGFRKMS